MLFRLLLHDHYFHFEYVFLYVSWTLFPCIIDSHQIYHVILGQFQNTILVRSYVYSWTPLMMIIDCCLTSIYLSEREQDNVI